MPRIEVIPKSNSISAPGWAYVPDNGYDPSKAAIQPSGARKRAARASGVAVGDTTTRQQNAVLKHLAELEKDSHRDVQISVPSKKKDTPSRGKLGEIGFRSKLLKDTLVSKNKSTQNVRRILTSQKTFANHLADEEAELVSQTHNHQDSEAGPFGAPRTAQSKFSKASAQKRVATSEIQPAPTALLRAYEVLLPAIDNVGVTQNLRASEVSEPLLRTYVPFTPSDEVMSALLSCPPLSYNNARAAPSLSKPQRRFCEICGYWGTIKCIKCGARVCGLDCKTAHSDGRCVFYT
jgi:zinc finger HIT domain-containing protein 1